MDASIAIRLHANDDVVIATRQLMPGNAIPGETCTVRDLVPPGHKVAAHDIKQGESVRRYNQIIGFAKTDIAAGQHVHVQNLAVGEFERDYAVGTARFDPPKVAQPALFKGFKRANGKVGTRNYIGVIASVNCSATVVRAIANHFSRSVLAAYPNIDGVVPMPHPLGCGMNSQGEGMLALKRTMLGYAQHPNFAGVLFVGLGCEMNQVQPLIEQLGTYPEGMLGSVNIQELGGTSKAIAKGIELVEAMLPKANAFQREDAPISNLIIGLNCGGSDGYSGITANPALGGAVDMLVAHGATAILSETPEIYGAEHLLTCRAATPAIADKLIGRIAWWKHYTSVNGGEMDNNPSVGNKAGGLTTILEKSLGAVAKGGTTTLQGVYEYAEQIDTKGFVYMDTPGYDPVSATGQAAGGAQLICFTTGRGSAFGCAGVPTIKLATNNALWNRQREDMDVNCGDLLDGVPMKEISQRIFDSIIAYASGEKAQSEKLGYGNDEFLPWQIGAVM
ncbi:UxaA family hydrolase [Uliginosibacterium sp. TH139]|uniref:UxaA family hydrolase n=1 Tax=Uliginosibacterium sp. TH139 TaxID=2067453 RepID=UPI000C799D40|nr:altronate dehydratase family protein [Uliginosibacterium sp. TH139]PLK49621.1 galactonate dehydratase [Uliginosibacterium sp. TH139]